MKKELLLFIYLFILNHILHGQTEADTTILIPVIVLENSKAVHAPGMTISTLDSAVRLTNQYSSVAELISRHSAINIRSYGNGLLATINSRGLGANHTSISWNGLPLNSANLGLTDLSLLPSNLFNEIAIVSGGTGSIYGNNSMGVAVELLNTPKNTTELNISGMNGSYGTVGSNINFDYGNKKLQSSSRFFISESKNNFRFKNISKQEGPVNMQSNAKQEQIGFMQIINYNFNNSTLFRGGLWYQFSEREIPPLMFTSRGEEFQRDSSFRIFGEWKKTLNKIIVSNKTSYFNEFIFYENPINKISGRSDVKNYRNEIELKYYPHNNIIINSSVTGEIAEVDIKEYNEVKKNNRLSVNVISKYRIKNKWQFGGGIKKEFTDLLNGPLSLSTGVDGPVLNKIVFFAANISSSYTLPTLNDLYWKPGGNENLVPEKGINSQLNFSFPYNREGKLSVTGYYSIIDDWIQWIPNSSGLFSPINIKQVESQGIESTIKQNFTWKKWKLIFSGNYAFTNTINKSFENNKELENKQLVYIPKHSANSFVLISFNNISTYSNWEFTGERFTTADNTHSLDSYYLIDLGLMFNYRYDLYQFTIKPEIKNLLDVAYQPIPWRAMPGRSYFLTISLNLNFKPN